MRVGNVQIEEEKIDHVSIKKPIGKISEDASQQERQRDVAPNIWWSPPQKKNQNNEKRDRRNYDEESVVVPEGTKRRAGIGYVNQNKEIRYYRAPRPLRTNESQDQLFCPLIERVDREREKEDEFHIFPAIFVMSSGVETSLIVSFNGERFLDFVPLRSIALGMTEKDHRAVFSKAVTTLSQRSHKSGCALLAPTVGR
jgi:hypothetical protein